MHLQENTLLQGGKYRIVRYISRGGFGCTYEAVNTTMRNRRVAIKELFVSDFCNRDPRTGSVTVLTQSKQPLFDKLRTKFLDEAEAIMDLNHTGIVRVTDFFEENGTAYYVMDYIDGQSLRDKVGASGELSEADALRYIRQVADALQYIHTNNRLHLDIKPANIMIDGKDKAILIDFGVSKQYDEASGENTSTLMGYTKGYAPVEQSNNSISKFLPATDIYALGATFYNLMSGAVPPPATELASGEELPPLPARVSTSTRQAVLSAMTINKHDRPQSVADFLALLDGKEDSGKTHFDDGETDYNAPGKTDYEEPIKRKPKPKSDTPIPWLMIALAVVIMGVAAVVLIKPKHHSGGEVIPADTITLAVDTVASSDARSERTTEKLIQDALAKQNEKSDEMEKLKAENERLREAHRQDSLAAVKKAEEERQEKERQAKEAREAEAARKAEEARKAAAQQVVATRPSNGYINGHEWVDLGLSVKWATCNVGASSASDWGNYYAWGETSTKTESGYWESNSTTFGKSIGDISGDSRYDAARRNWGGSWRMPTKAECQELKDNCTWTWTTQGGHNGYRVTSKKNGNSIFLPAAGWYGGSSPDYRGEYGYCWSSTPDESDTEDAYSLGFDSGSHDVDWGSRYYGHTVRPVCD